MFNKIIIIFALSCFVGCNKPVVEQKIKLNKTEVHDGMYLAYMSVFDYQQQATGNNVVDGVQHIVGWTNVDKFLESGTYMFMMMDKEGHRCHFGPVTVDQDLLLENYWPSQRKCIEKRKTDKAMKKLF